MKKEDKSLEIWNVALNYDFKIESSLKNKLNDEMSALVIYTRND